MTGPPHSRSSKPAGLESRAKWCAPGPSEEELRQILRIAMRVPDHGKLSPWRFVVVGKDQREHLAVLLHKALQAEDECAGPAHHEKEDEFARQGETLIVLVSSPVPGHKIPVWEQELSAGAAAMNLLTAAHAHGLCRWLDHRLARLFADGQRGLLPPGRAYCRLRLHRLARSRS